MLSFGVYSRFRSALFGVCSQLQEEPTSNFKKCWSQPISLSFSLRTILRGFGFYLLEVLPLEHVQASKFGEEASRSGFGSEEGTWQRLRNPKVRCGWVFGLTGWMLTLRSEYKLTFIEELTFNNYKFNFSGNVQILTFINIGDCEESL